MLIFSNDYSANVPESKYYAVGGPANFARGFKDFLRRNNHHWIGLVIAFTDVRTPQLKLVERVRGRRYYRLILPRQSIKKIFQAKKNISAIKIFKEAIELIAGLISQTDPDIIFLNGYGLPNWLILKAAQKKRRPIAIQHAGIFSKELETYQDIFSVHGRKIMENMEKESARIVKAHIFLNDFSRRYFNLHVAKTIKAKTEIIPLPLDFNEYQKKTGAAKKKSKERFKIGVIARWDRIKNHEAVMALARQAKAAGLPWCFYAVTIVPKVTKKKRLKTFYRKNIEIVPPLDRRGIADFCRRMDLLILPSHFETAGFVVLEAVAYKTPIAISPYVGFVDDFKKMGAADWIVDFSDASKAAKKISQIALRPMPVKLRDYLEKQHRSKKVFTQYIKLFKKIIAKP